MTDRYRREPCGRCSSNHPMRTERLPETAGFAGTERRSEGERFPEMAGFAGAERRSEGKRRPEMAGGPAVRSEAASVVSDVIVTAIQ